MSGRRRLTRDELGALQAEVRAAEGDGWTVELTGIDGIPVNQYVTADEEHPA